jgi:hypothetical protein
MWPVILCSLREGDVDIGRGDESEGEGEDEGEGFGRLIIVGYYKYSRGFKVGRFRFTRLGRKGALWGDLCGL